MKSSFALSNSTNNTTKILKILYFLLYIIVFLAFVHDVALITLSIYLNDPDHTN